VSNDDPLALLGIARNIAAEAGHMAARMRSDGVSVQATKSSQLDIVTQADVAVEALIRTRLQKTRPDDGFLGEESGEDEGRSGVTWVVDPIDGTVNYLYGSPYYAVSIAAMEVGPDGVSRAIAGCVFAPVLGAEYTAAVGHGARLNDNPIRVNDNVALDRALISTGFPYDLAKRDRILKSFAALVTQVRDFRLNGAASIEVCGVAEGRIDGVFLRGLPIWDYAAAALIATEAGAKVTGANDTPPSADLVLVGNPDLTVAIEAFLY
jgi:myo-inositol-1(or 4)-monophosphatase